MTLVLKPDFAPDRASMLTLIAALAVSKAISEKTGQEAEIKWPNDIVMNGKKSLWNLNGDERTVRLYQPCCHRYRY